MMIFVWITLQGELPRVVRQVLNGAQNTVRQVLVRVTSSC